MERDAEHQRLQGVLQTHPELELVMLFGSLARGTATVDSDLDIAVSAGTSLDVEARIRLIDELALAAGRPVDLVDLTRAGEPLLGQIMTTGVRLWGSDEAQARFLTRHLFDQADFLPYRDRILAARRDAWING